MPEKILVVENLKKYYGRPKLVKAVDDVSFTVNKGEIIGLLGPNGAGKTTTIQMLLGALTPTGGKIFYFGKDFSLHQQAIRQRLNYASGYYHLPNRITVWESLDVYGRLYSVKDRINKIEKLLKTFRVWGLKDKLNGQLSAGQATRVSLAKAFLNWPEIILLDEPTASLDPEIAYEVRQFLKIQQSQYQATMLLASHNMKEVEELCHKVIFLHNGKIIAYDSPAKLSKQNQKVRLKLQLDKNIHKAKAYLEKIGSQFTLNDNKIAINLNEPEAAKVLYRLSENGVVYSEIEVVRPTLEDFFLQIVKGKINEP